MLGLADEVGGDEGRISRIVGEDGDLSGSGLGIDADESATQSLGCRDVDVAGTGDEVDRIEDRTVGIRTAVSKERDALRTTDGPDLVDAEKCACREDGRVRPTTEVLLRR